MDLYQQIPVGIPASQDPYPSHPYSQNFPDEPESDSSQIQVPSISHPPQNYPQYSYYGPPQVPISQPEQIYAPGQIYNQPGQYAMVAGFSPIDPKRAKLEKQIKEIDARLDSGCSYVYKLWLYASIFCSCLYGLFYGLAMTYLLLVPILDSKRWPAFGVALLYVTWCVWALQQSLIMKNAMRTKSLEGARRGFRMMLWFAVYYLLTFIALIFLSGFIFDLENEDVSLETMITHYVMVAIVFYILPMFCNLFGAGKVLNLLAKREPLVLELNPHQPGKMMNWA